MPAIICPLLRLPAIKTLPCSFAENNKVSVTDLSSTNGTYLDDEELVPLRAIEMTVGAEVTFGESCHA